MKKLQLFGRLSFNLLAIVIYINDRREIYYLLLDKYVKFYQNQ